MRIFTGQIRVYNSILTIDTFSPKQRLDWLDHILSNIQKPWSPHIEIKVWKDYENEQL